MPDIFDQVGAPPQTQAQPSGDVFDQVAAQPQPSAVQPEGTLSKIGDVAADVGTGIAKGAGQTVNTIGGLISKVAPSIVRPSDVQGMEQIEAPTNTAQKVGVAGEGLAEFLLGDEALKGLSLGARLLKAGKIASIIEESPRLRTAVKIGMNAIRQGGVTSTEALAKGATPGQAAEAGAAGGLLSASAQSVIPAYSALKGALSTKAIQPVLQNGIRTVMDAVADENGVERPSATSVRDVVKDVADKVYAKSKAIYAQLDEATDGRFQRFEDQLRNINRKLQEVSGIDDEKEADLLSRKTDVEAAQSKAFEDAKAKGVDPQLVDEARANYKKAQALYDLNGHVEMSAEGLRPGAEISDINKRPSVEEVDPRKLFSRLNKLNNSGRLQEAVGNHANDLLNHADNASETEQRILRNQRLAKKVAGVAALGAGYHVVTHVFRPGVGLVPVE
jgi:hypothetical protein